MVFPVVMYGWESGTVKEGWAPKTWCFWTVVLENTLESSLDCKEIKPVHPKGNPPWIFTGMTDAIAEAPPDAKSWFTGKDPDSVKDWGQKEKEVTENEIFGWHHWLNGMSLSKRLEGQKSLVCCSPWSQTESDITWRLNNRILIVAQHGSCSEKVKE